MTLLDFPGKVACTIFLGGCDLRCPFCHNAELIDGSSPPIMDDSELLAFLASRKKLLDGVCITGGEPLLRPNIETLIRPIRELGYAIKLDTNGTHPQRLKTLIDAKLIDYVAMDIKNSPTGYPITTGCPEINLTNINASIELLKSDLVDYEFRTTVIQEYHNDDSFEAIAKWLKGAKRYYLQPFVDRDTVPNHTLHAPNEATLKRYSAIASKQISCVQIRGL